VSCEKDPDNLTVVLNLSGTLSFKVTDNNLNRFKGAEVSIHSSDIEGGLLFRDSTDVNGMCSFGKVLQDQYKYYVVAEKDNKVYSIHESFQVIAGDDKIINVNPFSNVGDARIKILNYNEEPIADVNVAIILHPDHSSTTYYFQDLIDKAYGIGMTDSEGWVEFHDLPVDHYNLLIYYGIDNYVYTINRDYLYMERDTKNTYTIQINL
jgi:hypothetical protein